MRDDNAGQNPRRQVPPQGTGTDAPVRRDRLAPGSDAVLTGAQARAEARRLRTRAEMWQELVEQSWQRSLAAAAAGQPAEALRWLERAYRMAPKNGTITVALAGALLQAGDAGRAAGLFRPLAEGFAMPEAWAGLAACLLRLGDLDGAVTAVAAGLQCGVPAGSLPVLAAAVAREAGLPGWVGLDGDGWLHAGPGRPGAVLLDRVAVRPAWTRQRGRLPAGWHSGRVLDVPEYLGSPLDVAAIARMEGFVEAWNGGLRGWAWHPADLARRPALVVAGDGLSLPVVAGVRAEAVQLDRPLAHPWAFEVPAVALAGVRGAVAVRGADGRHLLGSPLDPGLEGRAAVALALAVRDGGPGMPAWADLDGVARADAVPGRRSPATVAARGDANAVVRAAPGAGVPGRVEIPGVRLAVAPATRADRGQPVPLVAALDVPLRAAPDAPGVRVAVVPGVRVAMGPGVRAVAAQAVAARAGTAAVDVVVPVFRGVRETLACLESVFATVPRGTRVVVVDDASPEAELRAVLDGLARRRRIVLVRHGDNRGFPTAANSGLRAGAGRDAILLNSDTLVPPGWLERLRAAAYSAPDIGSVTPLSNDATILSYPDPDGGNPVPDLAGVAALDALARAANGDATLDVPTGVGFCLYLRRDCLDAVGLLREDVFAQGYGEENDWCLRARTLGWRSVAAPGVFVGHIGSASFGAARRHLIERNMAVLNRLHPGYDALIQAFEQVDPLRAARRRMDEVRWAAGRRAGGAVVAITHGGGGGVERVVQERAASWAAAGQRPVVLRPVAPQPGVPQPGAPQPGVLRPGVPKPGRPSAGCRVEAVGEAYPNLVYDLPGELPALVRLLRPDRVRRVELHHQLGHHPGVAGLARLLRAPQHVVVHDYAGFCPRIALVSTGRRYCGEPDLDGCEACVADLGTNLEEDVPVRALVARSAAVLAGAASVTAPSRDAAARMRRHFPGVVPGVQAWEDDGALPPLDAAPPGPVRRVCVAGALGLEKGYEVLLDCVRDARRRGLPLEFVVVGYTSDDERLLAAGPVFVTGEYRDADAVALIRAQGAHLAFLPSVWPETWCFALSRAWQAGLAAAAFDLGAQAERIRATGRGWLLPLGLPAGAVNDALLRVALPGVGSAPRG